MTRNRAFHSISLLTGANLGNALVSFFISVITARTLGPEGFGSLSLLMATCLFLALMLDFGLSQVMVARVAHRKSTRLYRDIIKIRVIFAGAASTGLLLLNFFIFFAYPQIAHPLRIWSLAAVAILWQPIISTEQAHAQGLREMKRVSLYIAAPNFLRLLLVLPGALVHSGLDYFIFAFSTPAVIISCWIVVQNPWMFTYRLDTRLIRKILPTIALSGITVCLSAALYRTGLWTVSYLAGIDAAGKYAVAFQMASLFFITGSSISLYFFPEIVRIDRAGNMFRFFVSYLRKGIPATLLLIPCAGIFAASAPLIFGSKYYGLEMITFLLMLSFLLSVLNGPFYLFQQSRMRYGLLVKIHLLQIIFLIAGCALLVPHFGVTGAAIADLVMRVFALSFYIANGLLETRRESLERCPSN